MADALHFGSLDVRLFTAHRVGVIFVLLDFGFDGLERAERFNSTRSILLQVRCINGFALDRFCEELLTGTPLSDKDLLSLKLLLHLVLTLLHSFSVV